MSFKDDLDHYKKQLDEVHGYITGGPEPQKGLAFQMVVMQKELKEILDYMRIERRVLFGLMGLLIFSTSDKFLFLTDVLKKLVIGAGVGYGAD